VRSSIILAIAVKSSSGTAPFSTLNNFARAIDADQRDDMKHPVPTLGYGFLLQKYKAGTEEVERIGREFLTRRSEWERGGNLSY
jgi:hypothetical protein